MVCISAKQWNAVIDIVGEWVILYLFAHRATAVTLVRFMIQAKKVSFLDFVRNKDRRAVEPIGWFDWHGQKCLICLSMLSLWLTLYLHRSNSWWKVKKCFKLCNLSLNNVICEIMELYAFEVLVDSYIILCKSGVLRGTRLHEFIKGICLKKLQEGIRGGGGGGESQSINQYRTPPFHFWHHSSDGLDIWHIYWSFFAFLINRNDVVSIWFTWQPQPYKWRH